MMRFRGKLFRQFRVSNSTNDLRASKQFRNRAVNEQRESKKNCYSKYFDEQSNSMKILSKGINNIVNLKPYNLDKILHTQDSKGSLIQAPGRIANELNLFFINMQVALHRHLEIQNPLCYTFSFIFFNVWCFLSFYCKEDNRHNKP